MAASNFRTILIQGEVENFLEKPAGASGIKPGHLLAISSGNVVVHATADGVSQKFFALESQTANSATANSIDVTYASGDTVYYKQCETGDVIYAWLADSMTTVAGVTPLVSNGDGTLKTVTVGTSTLADAVVGYAEEAVVTSGAVARCRVRIR